MATTRLQRIAVGFAGAALVVAVATVVIVARRGSVAAAAAQLPRRTVAVADVAKIDTRVHPEAVQAGESGVVVVDAAARAALGLDEADQITAINGHPTHRAFEVRTALFDDSLTAVTTLFVEVIHDHSPELRIWTLVGNLRDVIHTGASSGSSSAGSAAAPSPPDPVAASITKIDDTHFTIPRAMLDQVPQSLTHSRLVPHLRNQVVVGFKLYAVRPGGLFAALGLQNGDAIVSLNGEPLTDPNRVLEMYSTLRAADKILIAIERRGDPLEITVDIK